MEEELRQLLELAREQLKKGKTQEFVNGKIQQATAALAGGPIEGFTQLAQRVFGVDAPVSEEEAALRRFGERETGAVDEFGRLLAQGATFGFADELAAIGPEKIMQALFGGPAGQVAAAVEFESPEGQRRLEESRQRIEDIREVGGPGTLAIEAAGGLLLPAGQISTLARAAGGGLRGAAAAGGALGLVEGGLFGLGEAQGTFPERVVPAATGAAVGGTAGAVLGPAATGAGRLAAEVGRRIPGLRRVIPEPSRAAGVTAEALREVTPLRSVDRAGRFADELERLTGLESSIVTGEASAQRNLQRISRDLFQPIEEAFEEVNDAGVLAVVRRSDFASHVRPVSKEVAAGTRSPSFEELQGIRQRLQGKVDAARRAGRSDLVASLTEARAELTAAMEEAIPGLRDANRLSFEGNELLRSFPAGQKAFNKPAEEVARTLADLPTDAAREGFRRGMQNRIVTGLRLSEGSSTGAVNKLLKAGPEMRARIENLFVDPNNPAAGGRANFEEFLSIIEREKSVKARADLFRRTFPWLFGATLLAGTGAGGFVVGRAIFGGGQ